MVPRREWLYWVCLLVLAICLYAEHVSARRALAAVETGVRADGSRMFLEATNEVRALRTRLADVERENDSLERRLGLSGKSQGGGRQAQ